MKPHPPHSWFSHPKNWDTLTPNSPVHINIIKITKP